MVEKKRLFVVSDIHGHYTAMKTALDASGFDPNNGQHLLVCCGDYFDRGTQNLQVLKYMERLENKVLLRGNHEDLLLKVFYTGHMDAHNYINGTVETITEFFGKYALDEDGNIDFSGKSRILDRMTDFILETQDYFETAHYVFVHGWLPNENGKALEDWRNAPKDAWEKARWTKWASVYDGRPPLPGKTLICGHYPSLFAAKVDPSRSPEDASIFYGNGLIVTDAGTYTSGQVNVLVIEDSLLSPPRHCHG